MITEYHPEMLNVHRIIQRLKTFQKVKLPEYEVIAQIVKTQKSAIGL